MTLFIGLVWAGEGPEVAFFLALFRQDQRTCYKMTPMTLLRLIDKIPCYTVIRRLP